MVTLSCEDRWLFLESMKWGEQEEGEEETSQKRGASLKEALLRRPKTGSAFHWALRGYIQA